MIRGGANQRVSAVGGRSRASNLLTPGYTTPNVRGDARRSLLPRVTAAARGASETKTSNTAEPPAGVGKRQSGGERSSLRGGLSSLTSVTRLSIASRTTPARDPLSAANYLAPPSTSARLSTESRTSTSGRRKKERRPISDPTFKKECVDNIFAFLLSNSYCSEMGAPPNRRMVTNPTTKDFVNMFTFIYSQLVQGYKMKGRIDEEVPKVLQTMQYKVPISKTTFATVATMHSWPILLTMLSWLCDIISNVITTNPKDIGFPVDFDTGTVRDFDRLEQAREVLVGKTAEEWQEYIEMYRHKRLAELNLEERGAAVAAETAALRQQLQQLQQEQQHRSSELQQIRNSNVVLEGDEVKMEQYLSRMQLKVQHLRREHEGMEEGMADAGARKERLENVLVSLRSDTASQQQQFTSSEIFSIMNHEQTSTATLQQLHLQKKQMQEKKWELEVQISRCHSSLTSSMQQYNSSPLARLGGVVGDGGDEQLVDTLREVLREGRGVLLKEHATKNSFELDCITSEAGDKKLEVSQLDTQVRDMEENIHVLQQQNTREEVALTQQIAVNQAELSAMRKEQLPDVEAKQKELLLIQKRVVAKQEGLLKRAVETNEFRSKLSLKMKEQLKYEEEVATLLIALVDAPVHGEPSENVHSRIASVFNRRPLADTDRTAVADSDRTAVADSDRTAVADSDQTAVADTDRSVVDDKGEDKKL